MLDVRYSTKFKKDFKICVKRRYKMEQFRRNLLQTKILQTILMEFPKNEELQISPNQKTIFSLLSFSLLTCLFPFDIIQQIYLHNNYLKNLSTNLQYQLPYK